MPARATRSRSRLWFSLVSALSCAPTAAPSQPPAAPPAATQPSLPARVGGSAPRQGECAVDADCQASREPCLRAACEQHRCVQRPALPRTQCELSEDAQARLLAASSYGVEFSGEPGVCSNGACVYRPLCLEACGQEIGATLGETFRAELERCDAKQPNRSGHRACMAALNAYPATLELLERVDQCAHACGYPKFEARAR